MSGSRPLARPRPAALVGAIALMQALMILTLPPFRGLDEVDHAYRAAAVAHGQWAPSRVQPEDGRGMVLRVPESVVSAAGPQCSALRYTRPDNCAAIDGPDERGLVAAASAAYAQSPVYYAVVGLPTRVLEGGWADYAMRAVASLLVLLMFTAALLCCTRAARTTWPMLALTAALTPALVYTSVIPAPNGLEIAAGAALWTSLVFGPRHGYTSGYLGVAFVAAVCLLGLRQLGPLFLVLIVVHALPFQTRESWRQLRDRWRTLVAMAVGALAVGVGHLMWIRSAGYPGEGVDYGSYPLQRWLTDPLLWAFQALATGQSRVNAAPVWVYALALPPIGVVIALALLSRARRSHRSTLLLALVTATALPLLFSLLTFATHGPFWQGRYGLAFTIGCLVLAGRLLDDGPERPGHEFVTWLVLLCVVGANAANTVAFGLRESQRTVSLADPLWPQPHPVLLLAGFAVALLLVVRAFGLLPGGSRRPQPVSTGTR